MAYRDNQPFNENMLRPCPMLENAEVTEVVHETEAGYSVDRRAGWGAVWKLRKFPKELARK